MLAAAELIGSNAVAQSSLDLERMLTVIGEQRGCVTAKDLRSRVARYLAPGIRASDLQIEVDLERRPPRFSLRRDAELVAERRFERVPSGCTERRDALALAIAVAIEHAAPRERAAVGTDEGPVNAASTAPGSTHSATTPARTTGPTSGASGAAPAASSRSASDPSSAQAAPSAESSARRSVRPAPPPAPEAEAKPAQAGGDTEEDEPEYSGELPELTDTRGPTPPWVRPSARWMVFGGAQLLLAALPSDKAVPAFSAGAEFAVVPELRVSLSGLISLEQSQVLAQEVLTQLYGAQLLACLNAPVYSVITAVCAGAAGGVVSGEGQAFAMNNVTSMAWLAGALRATLEFPADSVLAGRVFAEGRINLVRPELEVAVAEAPARYLRNAAPVFGGAIGAELIVRLE